MRVVPSFPFDEELRRIAIAQALRSLAPEQVPDHVSRLLAYAAAGHCPVSDVDDAEARRRHALRPAQAGTPHPVPARNI